MFQFASWTLPSLIRRVVVYGLVQLVGGRAGADVLDGALLRPGRVQEGVAGGAGGLHDEAGGVRRGVAAATRGGGVLGNRE